MNIGNLFKGIGDSIVDSTKIPLQMGLDTVKDTVKNPKNLINPKKQFEHAEKYIKKVDKNAKYITQEGLGIRGWVGDHPLQTAGAVLAAIYGGGALMAGGAGAAGGGGAAGASAGAAGTGAGTIGGAGTAAYMAPTAAGGVSTAMPATSTIMGLGQAGVSGGSVGAGTGLTGSVAGGGLQAAGGTSASAAGGSSFFSNPNNWQQIAKITNSLKSKEEPKPQFGSMQLAPAYRPNFQRNNVENPLLSRTMQEMYSQPMYQPLRLK